MREITAIDVRKDVEEIIGELVTSSPEESARIKQTLRGVLLKQDNLEGIEICLQIAQTCDHETAAMLVTSFAAGVRSTCSDKTLADAAAGVMAELVSDFCGD